MFGVLSKKILPIIFYVILIIYFALLCCSDIDYLHSVYGVDVALGSSTLIHDAPNIYTFQAFSWAIGIFTVGLSNSVQSLIDYR